MTYPSTRGIGSALEEAVSGGVAGVLATLAMSLVMLAAQRLGLMGMQPPERIVERGMRAVGHRPDGEEVDVAAAVAHLGFGTACGAIYGVLAVRTTSASWWLGVPFALLVWLVSYAGWIPALRILPAPPDDRLGRAWSMFVAHLVYGAVLGLAWRTIARR